MRALRQGLNLFNRKDVYDSPYEYLGKSRRNSTYINGPLCERRGKLAKEIIRLLTS